MKFKEIKEFIKSGADNNERCSTVLLCVVRPLYPHPPFLLDNAMLILSLVFTLIYMRAQISLRETVRHRFFAKVNVLFIVYCLMMWNRCCNRPNMI